MTDIPTSAPVAFRRSKSRRPSFPRLGIGASLAALCASLGNAFELAYVDPYTDRKLRSQVAPEDGDGRRDPDW